MAYLSSIERLAMEEGHEKGLREGLLQGISAALKSRFGSGGLKLLPRVRALESTAKLQWLLQAIPGAASLEEVRKRLN
jgi:hypothetical protein